MFFWENTDGWKVGSDNNTTSCCTFQHDKHLATDAFQCHFFRLSKKHLLLTKYIPTHLSAVAIEMTNEPHSDLRKLDNGAFRVLQIFYNICGNLPATYSNFLKLIFLHP